MAEVQTRADIPEEARWDLAQMYASDELWEQALEDAQGLPAQLAEWKGKLGESPQALANALDAMFSAYRTVEKVYVYAHLNHDQDMGVSDYQSAFKRAQKLYHQLSEAVAFFDPELLQMEDGVLEGWLATDASPLAPYRVHLEDILRRKPHTLSQREEQLLAMAGEALGSSSQVFGMLNNLDIPEYLPVVKGEHDEEVQLTHATYQKLLQSRWRDVRRNAFHGFFGEFGKHRNTLAATLDGKVKSSSFKARARNYGSAREAALFSDNISTDVYDGLIDTIHSRLPDFYRYMELRKKMLDLDSLHIYDVSVPLLGDIDLKYTWEEAEELIYESLRPLGDDYLALLKQGFSNRWIDRYENKGKRSGAYSSGCYDSAPYILHNFNGTLNSVFTLTHELGHSIHSAFTNANQPYQTSHYKIFVAEVASTTNEALLVHHMLKQTDDPKVKAYILNHYLNDFRTTMFRQTMFGEFERDMYAAAESGQALTTHFLDEHYYKLTKLYFGDSFAWDDEDAPIAWEWCRIPHFYYDFYVYKYATGMAAATALSRGILEEGAPAVERYLHFLKSGGSRYPLELLQDAGVDLTTSAPVAASLDTFREILDQLEALLG